MALPSNKRAVLRMLISAKLLTIGTLKAASGPQFTTFRATMECRISWTTHLVIQALSPLMRVRIGGSGRGTGRLSVGLYPVRQRASHALMVSQL